MVGQLDDTSRRISSFYTTTKNLLEVSLQRISSGKRILEPRDGSADYFRAQSLRRDSRGYEMVQRDLGRGRSMMNTAEEAGGLVVNNLKEMKEVADDYFNATAGSDERTALQLKFAGLANAVGRIRGNAYLDGKELMAAGTVTSIMLDPNNIQNTLDLDYEAADIVDESALTIGVDRATTQATIDTEMQKAMRYLAKTSGYIASIDSQVSLTSAVIENKNAYESTLVDVDDAAEMTRVTTHNLRQQASLSMLSQANMYRMGVLQLLE